MIILVDFDGTIEDSNNVPKGKRNGPPLPGAVAAIRYLHQAHHIIILTGRPVHLQGPYNAVKNWLDHFQIPYDDITNVKPSTYDLIIDNRALHFNGWDKTLPKVVSLFDEKNRMAWSGADHPTAGVH